MNFEQAGVLDFTPDGDIPLAMLDEVLGFIDRVRGLASQDAEGKGPNRSLAQFITQVRALVKPWGSPGWARGDMRAEWLLVEPGAPSLLQQVKDRMWSGPGPNEVQVLSPFFDSGPALTRTVGALHELMGAYGEREVVFQVAGTESPDGEYQLEAPEGLRDSGKRGLQHLFAVVRPHDENGEPRPLHAKSLWLQRESRAVHTVGSSNFTSPGMGLGAGPVNVEANLAYLLTPASNKDHWKSCEASTPPFKELDLETDEVRFLKEPKDQTSDPSEYAPLPAGFGSAQFRPAAMGGDVLLVVHEGVPVDFHVESLGGATLLTHAQWQGGGCEAKTTLDWKDPRPPACLVVRWTGVKGDPRKGLWVVNVTDTSELAPPSELQSLTLDELLEVLTSARPLHLAMAGVLARREAVERSDAPIVDPHKKVDVRNFLLQRVRLLSRALEGMRERLERPAPTREALAWRLFGPLGPVELARKLAAKEGDGAAFMIAEVALTLKQANLRAIQEYLGGDIVQKHLADAIAQLQRMAAEHPASANLKEYVAACFEEAQR